MPSRFNDFELMSELLYEAALVKGVFETDADPTPHPDGDKLCGLITDDDGNHYRLTLELMGDEELVPTSSSAHITEER